MQIEPSGGLENRIIESAMAAGAGKYPHKRRISMKAVMIAATLAILMMGVTALAYGELIIGKFFPQEGLTALYDAEGNLIWRQTLDENGNIIYVDYEAEPFEGDVRVKGFEDVFSHNSLDVPCFNGVSVKHIVNHGEIAIYTNETGAWSLKEGQSIDITFDITDEDWWGVLFGYYKDGEYIPYGYDPGLEIDQRYILSGETTIQFIAPADGEYAAFFMVNFSPSAVLVNSCTIS
jgi:hypothetical protein